MTEELQSLLARIQAEGVERAEAQAARITQQAEARAAVIVAEAEEQATRLRRAAETDAAASVERGQTALEQAGRDFLLALEKSVEAVLRETLCDTVAEALTPEVMSDILVRLADAYAAHDMNESRVDVLLSPEDRDAVGAIVMEKYRELVRQGLTLRPDERVDGGFKVSFVDYHLYHDFSAQALAEALAPVLKAPLCDIVKRAAAERV
jgi:V/A-type H+/Na+-transporting ATPase subunit E